MTFVLHPWHLLLTILAGLINSQQQGVIEYLRTENRVLKEAHGKRRIRLNDDQRRRLAVKGKILGRKVLGGIGTSFTPDEAWMKQVARNLSGCTDDFLVDTKYLLRDRDTKFCAAFRSILKDAGVKAVRLPPRSPDLNAHLARFLRSLKEECLDRMIFFGETSLQRATTEFLSHYHRERNHQGLANRLLVGGEEADRAADPIDCRKRLGGLLRYYYRAAA